MTTTGLLAAAPRLCGCGLRLSVADGDVCGACLAEAHGAQPGFLCCDGCGRTVTSYKGRCGPCRIKRWPKAGR